MKLPASLKNIFEKLNPKKPTQVDGFKFALLMVGDTDMKQMNALFDAYPSLVHNYGRGSTIHVAAALGNTEVLKELKTRGADVTRLHRVHRPNCILDSNSWEEVDRNSEILTPRGAAEMFSKAFKESGDHEHAQKTAEAIVFLKAWEAEAAAKPAANRKPAP